MSAVRAIPEFIAGEPTETILEAVLFNMVVSVRHPASLSFFLLSYSDANFGHIKTGTRYG